MKHYHSRSPPHTTGPRLPVVYVRPGLIQDRILYTAVVQLYFYLLTTTSRQYQHYQSMVRQQPNYSNNSPVNLDSNCTALYQNIFGVGQTHLSISQLFINQWPSINSPVTTHLKNFVSFFVLCSAIAFFCAVEERKENIFLLFWLEVVTQPMKTSFSFSQPMINRKT